MSKATPGPWTVEGDALDGMWVTGPDRNAPAVCDIMGRGSPHLTEEDIANAHLIAAAPELLAACKATLAFFDYCSTDSYHAESARELVDQLRAAIANAEGMR